MQFTTGIERVKSCLYEFQNHLNESFLSCEGYSTPLKQAKSSFSRSSFKLVWNELSMKDGKAIERTQLSLSIGPTVQWNSL